MKRQQNLDKQNYNNQESGNMSDGVKGPNGPVYTPTPPPQEDQPSSPVLNPKPQIPRAPSKAPQSILKSRTVTPTQAVPQVNKKVREKMELENRSQNLVAQLQHLLTLQQFLEYKEAILEAIANPEAIPDDFTIVYIDDRGQEITVIPPEQALLSLPAIETRLRNELKSRVGQLDEIFTDDDIGQIDNAVLAVSENLEACSEELIARGAEAPAKPDSPQRVFLEPEYLTEPPATIPLPTEDVFALDEKPVTTTSKKQRFKESDFSEQWVNFYSSPQERIPSQHYTLEDIRLFSDEELESNHDYIQLLFPNQQISAHNPGAPLLTDELATKIRETPALKNEALESVDQMLKFWGLERSGNDVRVNQQEAARHHKWDGPFDHNHKRITRMLDFLMECGQFRLATNIEQALQSQRIAKQRSENTYWAEAVGRAPGKPRALAPVPPSKSVPTAKIHPYTSYVDAFPYDECKKRDRVDFQSQHNPGFVFSSFYKPQSPIEIDGEQWPTAEHYYQACKFKKGSQEWLLIKSLPDAETVYKYIYPNLPKDETSRKMHMERPEWLAKRNEVMMTALRAKARNVAEFRKALLDSGDQLLFEVSPKDSYWGTARDKTTGKIGKNVHGAMLMQIRDELKASEL